MRESGNTAPDRVGGTYSLFVKDKEGSALSETRFIVDTTGKRKVQETFQELFKDANIGDGSGNFEWGKAYYNYPKFDGKKIPRTFKPK